MLATLAWMACTSGDIGSGEAPEDEDDSAVEDTGSPDDSDAPDTGDADTQDSAPPTDTGPDAWRIYAIWAFAGGAGSPGNTSGTTPFQLDSDDFPIRLWVEDHEGHRVGDEEGPFYEGEDDTVSLEADDDPDFEAFVATLTDGTASTVTVGLTNVAGTVELTEDVPSDLDYAGHSIELVTLNLTMQPDMSGP
ncbi:MAG: hypothetical protein GY884_29365 [Proteobacteria bacterium]|nr:hypothetical protein [Pseudomonadota bacterium]